MRILITEFSATAGIFRFIVLFIVFIAVLVLAFYFTKWYANSGLVKKGYGNIKVVESYQVAPGKIIYIVKIGSQYVSIMTSKDNIVKLTELSYEDLELHETEFNNTSFKDVMGQMINNRKMKDDNKKNGK
ncbi:MAG: flagellar biosynthetic protein FliO [Lachnospiraceae bacterium]